MTTETNARLVAATERYEVMLAARDERFTIRESMDALIEFDRTEGLY